MTARQRSANAREAAFAQHFRRRILQAYAGADDATRSSGREWYATANREARRIARAHSLPVETAAAVIAALSPRTRWAENLRYADAACGAAARVRDDGFAAELCGSREEAIRGAVWEATEAYGLSDGRKKAAAILADVDPLAVLGGPKTRAFFRNICGDHEAVTVDVWAARIAYGGWGPVPAGRRYETIAGAYRAAAKAIGIPPAELQASTWIAIRGSAA